MRHLQLIALAALALLLGTGAHAREYGIYDPKRLLTVTETPSGKKYGFDGAYLDQMLNDLAAHAKNYPPQFDTPQDRQRATQDVKVISGMLDTLVNVPNPNPDLLLRAAHLGSMGHNLEIPGAADKANALFQRLLQLEPAHPRGNYLYGTFLAGAGKPREALPYLEKALAAGIADAAFTLGMAHLSLKDQDGALKYLEDYKRRRPGDANADRFIDAIRNGRIEIRSR
ncbi:MAG: tetratricopeptide repeat protein [Pseudomonadota bacterium]